MQRSCNRKLTDPPRVTLTCFVSCLSLRRHIVIERNPENNQVAAVVLKTRPEHDSDDSEEEARDEGEDTLS